MTFKWMMTLSFPPKFLVCNLWFMNHLGDAPEVVVDLTDEAEVKGHANLPEQDLTASDHNLIKND